MGILNDFKNMIETSKNNKITKQKAEEDRIKREQTWGVPSDNIDNVIQLGAINVEKESYKIISRQNYENWYLFPALSKQRAVILPIYLFKQMNSIYNDKPYDKIFYENRLNKFTTDWFSCDISEAGTIDGRSLNIAVAFYICYGVMVHKKFITEDINIENFYKLLIDKLGYTNIKMLSIEETA